MSSKRLPGKVLHKIKGIPLLGLILDRIKYCKVDDVVVLTSNEKSDNIIEKFCHDSSIKCFRGDLLNVASRFYKVLKKYPCNAFVRINGDSPLIDHNLINKGIELFKKGNYDIVTNVLFRTYPKGQSVEVVKSSTFINSYNDFTLKEDIEHVTKFFYKNSKNNKILNFKSKKSFGDIQLSVDTKDDLKIICNIFHKMTKKHHEYNYLDILNIYEDICCEKT